GQALRPAMDGTPALILVTVPTQQAGEPPERPLDIGKIHPVIPARHLEHRLVAGTTAPILKISPAAPEHDKPPFLLALADRNTHRIGLRRLPAILPERIQPRPAHVFPGDRTGHTAGLLPFDGIARDQPGHLIKVDPAFHTARMPDLRPQPTATKTGPKRTERRVRVRSP